LDFVLGKEKSAEIRLSDTQKREVLEQAIAEHELSKPDDLHELHWQPFAAACDP
jgi:hypothetical protein